MIGERKTINLREQDGSLLDLTTKIVAVEPTLSQESAVDKVAKSVGAGFMAGNIVKKSKRSQTEYAATTADKITSGFVGASAQTVQSYPLGKIYRQDNIIGSRIDYAKLKEGKGGNMTAMEIADFILTGKELDLKALLAEGRTKSAAMKIYTAVDATGAATGAQPAATGTDAAAALVDIKAGLRNVTATDMNDTNTMGLVRAAIGYLNKLGSAKSIETVYPWSINGLPLNKQAILTDYSHVSLLKDSFTRTVIDMSNPNAVLNFTGLVGFIDTVPVILTNQLDTKEAFVITSTRAMLRDLDPESQFLGVVSQGNGQAVKLANDEVVNVKPSEVVVALEQGRILGTPYFEEMFFIKDVA